MTYQEGGYFEFNFVLIRSKKLERYQKSGTLLALPSWLLKKDQITSIKSDNPKSIVSLDRVSGIMRPRLLCSSRINPSFMSPQSSDMIIIPTLLLSKWAWQAMWRIDSLRVAIVVSKYCKDRSSDL